MSTVRAVCVSPAKGAKKEVPEISLERGIGIPGDAHAGNWHRQVSLLALERIEEMRKTLPDLALGAFGENIVTEGLQQEALIVGRRLRLGPDAVLQITQLGKKCPAPCAIFRAVGTCIMPRHGTFARVIRSGRIAPGDPVLADPEWGRYRFAVLTISDSGSRGERVDQGGPLAAELVGAAIQGHEVAREILPDDRETIAKRLVQLCDEVVCDLVVTTGGTGLAPRDVTPEATRDVIHREIPGMAEAMRAAGLAKTPHAMLSRAICGQRGQTLILNLSGSPKAVREQLETLAPVLPHALEVATGIPQDCADLRPPSDG
ncbi:MAG: molybdopterin-binding protein [Polyangia bacterium]|nr:molybdopterin-binding protein [Polyangia bacterium]